MCKIKLVVFFCLILSLLSMSGCATKPRVSTDYEPSYNFAALKTFSIKETKADIREDLLISPFTYSHIAAQLNSELAKRYQVVSGEAVPDFYVSYHLVMEEKLDPRAYDDLYGFGMWGRGYRYPTPYFYNPAFRTGLSVYNQGNLIIDMVDAKTQQPIWRGVSEKRLSRSLTPQEQRQILTSAVLEVMAQFPPVK
jgi:hypothetical protein